MGLTATWCAAKFGLVSVPPLLRICSPRGQVPAQSGDWTGLVEAWVKSSAAQVPIQPQRSVVKPIYEVMRLSEPRSGEESKLLPRRDLMPVLHTTPGGTPPAPTNTERHIPLSLRARYPWMSIAEYFANPGAATDCVPCLRATAESYNSPSADVCACSYRSVWKL